MLEPTDRPTGHSGFSLQSIVTFWSCSAARATKRLLSQMRDCVVGRSRTNDELAAASYKATDWLPDGTGGRLRRSRTSTITQPE